MKLDFYSGFKTDPPTADRGFLANKLHKTVKQKGPLVKGPYTRKSAGLSINFSHSVWQSRPLPFEDAKALPLFSGIPDDLSLWGNAV